MDEVYDRIEQLMQIAKENKVEWDFLLARVLDIVGKEDKIKELIDQSK